MAKNTTTATRANLVPTCHNHGSPSSWSRQGPIDGALAAGPMINNRSALLVPGNHSPAGCAQRPRRNENGKEAGGENTPRQEGQVDKHCVQGWERLVGTGQCTGTIEKKKWAFTENESGVENQRRCCKPMMISQRHVKYNLGGLASPSSHDALPCPL